MTDIVIWDSVRQLIRDQELATALEALEQWLKAHVGDEIAAKARKWLDELILHHANLSRVQLRARKRLITREETDVELAQISENVLSLVNAIASEDRRRSASTSTPRTQIPAFVTEGKLEQITGTKSRLVMVSWLERGLWCSAGVCRLVSGARIGSGFRIDQDLILTNNHVISDEREALAFSAEFFYEERLDRTMRETVAVRLDSGRFWTSKEFDVTIVGAHFSEVSASQNIHVLPMRHAVPDIGDPVSIIQHPLGGPKQIALTSNEIIHTSGCLVHYVTDTLPGSSGSPVFNSDWEVIAVQKLITLSQLIN
jgi:hypothetical protein